MKSPGDRETDPSHANDAESRSDEVRAVWRKYYRAEVSERPEGSRRVHVVFRATPRVDPKPKRRKS